MAGHFYADGEIAEIYRWFAGEAAPSSPLWAEVCRWVAATPSVADRLDALPGMKRQPQLFLAALRYLDAPTHPGPELDTWVATHWAEVERAVLGHATQTNEPARVALHLPLLAGLSRDHGPLALVEVGSSAGLCLVPEAYAYRYELPGGRIVEVGEGDPVIECRVSGASPPEAAYVLPDLAWRCGIDLAPLDPADPDVRAWLRALVWPGQQEREERLARALDTASRRPVPVVRGDALEELAGVVAEARRHAATVVVMHTATLSYLPRERRAAFGGAVRELGAHWLSCEGERVVPEVRDRQPPEVDDGTPSFVLALDGHPLARVGQHGGWIHWS